MAGRVSGTNEGEPGTQRLASSMQPLDSLGRKRQRKEMVSLGRKFTQWEVFARKDPPAAQDVDPEQRRKEEEISGLSPSRPPIFCLPFAKFKPMPGSLMIQSQGQTLRLWCKAEKEENKWV